MRAHTRFRRCGPRSGGQWSRVSKRRIDWRSISAYCSSGFRMNRCTFTFFASHLPSRVVYQRMFVRSERVPFAFFLPVIPSRLRPCGGSCSQATRHAIPHFWSSYDVCTDVQPCIASQKPRRTSDDLVEGRNGRSQRRGLAHGGTRTGTRACQQLPPLGFQPHSE